ncbi:MAG: ABC transporter ATP-binding protein [Desulfobulbaceae bacterium A2]|nr:MAG: ABC transporter ATP-binding protein [Desulfobulbaceae bacterium A2]
MAFLLSAQGLSKGIGARTLFRGIDFTISPGERVGLIGPNGSGKSSLLRILAGLDQPDAGRIQRQKLVRVGLLTQDDRFDEEASVAANLAAPLAPLDLDEAERHQRLQEMLARGEFADPAAPARSLSGGWRKRLAICRALISRPDLLLLDEPTNHLDIEGILWLGRMLTGRHAGAPAAFLLVSHDRHLLEESVGRLVELSAVYPAGSFEVQGNYSDFLMAREEFLTQQQQEESRLSNKVRREVEWLRRGPKARTTKSRARIDAAGQLQEQLAEVQGRNRSQNTVDIDFAATGRKTKKLLEALGLAKSYAGQPLFAGIDLVLSPGTRLGLLGRNGCGKSTLMQLLASAGLDNGPRPDAGSIRLAEGVRVVSFDQRRTDIDPNLTLRRALAPDGDSIVFRDRSLHVVSWAKRFLFRPDQLETPVGQLSGGEQARILIAGLMRQPADILLLDEPTNDLDIPSLEVLEESLLEFPGALVLVSHDRFLLDRVCDRVLGFDGRGGAVYFADHAQWLAALREAEREQNAGPPPAAGSEPPRPKGKKPGLSWREQQEYDTIEQRILTGEEELERLRSLVEQPEVATDPARLVESWEELQKIEGEVALLYQRWQELEEKKAN